MKNLLKIFILTAFIALPLFTLAQRDSLQNPSAEHKARAMAQRFQEDLQLTQLQADQVYTLALNRLENIKLNKADPARFEKANQQALEKLPTILTKQQLEKYNALRSEAKKQKADYLKQNPGYNPSDEDLELDF
jgi:hypothetical protein